MSCGPGSPEFLPGSGPDVSKFVSDRRYTRVRRISNMESFKNNIGGTNA